MNRRWLVIGVFFVILVGVGLFVRANLPTLLEVSPANGDTQVEADTSLKLTFSKAMQPESVTENLEIQPPMQGSFAWEENTLVFTPDQTWPRGEPITVTLQSGARSTLGLPISQDQIWSFKVSPPLLVYLWPSDGPADLYAIDLIEGLVMRLTETGNGVLSYDISPDGREIFYSIRLDPQNSAIYRLQRVDNVTEEILFCENVLCSFPQISPSGKYLAYTRAPSNAQSEAFLQQIWLLPFVDEEPTPESQAQIVSDPVHQAGTPFWSPTGMLTFHDKEAQRFVVFDPQTNQRTYFPNETGEPGTWSPDGKHFIVHEIDFWGSGSLDYTSHLWRFDYPSGQSTELTLDLTLEDVTPSYSPNGLLVAFGRKHLDKDRWIPGSQLWLINADGSNPRQIINNPDFNHADFAWHPNGEYLAFVRHEQSTFVEPPEIWITRTDGTDAIRLVIDGYVPQWIP
jgi:Tol biopolymer transport system component